MSVTTDLAARAKIWLGARRATAWIVALAVALTSASLWGGLAADDYMHAVVLLGLPLPHAMGGPLDLFRFADGDPKTSRALMDIGQFPWTANPHTKFAFLRPLSAVTHVLDYAAWPRSPALMHAQSLAWFALALCAVAAVYRRFLAPRWVAGLALLLYAVDDTHGPTVGWLANRNAIIALALSLPVLLLHDAWRARAWKPGVWLGPLLLATSLLAGESALAIVAYLAAYAIHIDRGPWRARLAPLLPHAALLVIWRVAYAKLGYGVSGSGLYLDPGQLPREYLAALPRRFPFLVLAELGLPRSDLAETYEYMSRTAPLWAGLYAAIALGLLCLAMRSLWRRDPVARFFTTGMLLAVFPICAAFTSDRLLLFVGVGAMGLVAQLAAHAVTFGERSAAAYLLFVHLVVAPPSLALRSRYNDYQLWVDMGNESIPKSPDVTTKTVVLINPPNDLFYIYIPEIRAVTGEPRPARLRGLANVMDEVDVTRVDEYTLRVRPQLGFLEHESERMMVDERQPFTLGSRVDLPGMSVTITDMLPDGHPAEALFRFDKPLEDPSFVWLRWNRFRYDPWTPPPVGALTRVPARDFRSFVLDLEDRVTEGLRAKSPRTTAPRT